MKIFVCHYSKLTDRKKHILEQFEKHNFTNYEFIEDDMYEKYYNENIIDKKLGKGVIDLLLRHLYIYKLIAEKYDAALILEDDAQFCHGFKDKFEHYITQLHPDYDMLFIGGEQCNFHIPNDRLIPDVNIYKKELYPTSWGGDGATRATEAYIVSKKCTINICNYLQKLQHKINLPIDWYLNKVARDLNLNVYWAEPTICTQPGVFKSSLY